VNRFWSEPLNPAHRRLIFVAALVLIPVMFVPALPVWRMIMHAPQYPEGLNLVIYPNTIKGDVDKVKDSAVSARSCFLVEVMGGECGFLALMAGMTTGAEGVYLPEEGISLQRLLDDLDALRTGFSVGKRRGLLVRGERADDVYTTRFIESLLARESGGAFDVHGVVLGRVQQGGAPSPFDRIQATRLTAAAVDHLIAQALAERPVSAMVGLRDGEVAVTPLDELLDLVEPAAGRPLGPTWWMALRPLADLMASPRGEPEVPA